MTAVIEVDAVPEVDVLPDVETDAAAESKTERFRELRRRLRDSSQERRQFAAQLAESERGRRALALQVRTLRAHPQASALPEGLFAEAIELLDGLNRQFADAGATPGDVAAALGELPVAVVWLVGSVWKRQGRLPADPPSPARRLEAVKGA
jgi:hypothetical protein